MGRFAPQYSCLCAEHDLCGSLSDHPLTYLKCFPAKEERKFEGSTGFGGTMVSVLYRCGILPYTVSDLSDLADP